VAAGVLGHHRGGGVGGGVVHDEQLARQVHVLEDAVEDGDHRPALGGDRDGEGDPGGGALQVEAGAGRVAHSTVPLPSRFQMSTTGLSVRNPAYSRCGAAITSTSDRSSTSSSGRSVLSTVTLGSVHSTSAALNCRMRL